MGTWINFADVRARISLEDVIIRYYKIDTLKREGTKLIGPCPVHGGDSPRAFNANLERNIWHCFSRCKGGGNQLDFVAKKENVSIREAALRLQAFFLGNGGGADRPPEPPATTGAAPRAPTAGPGTPTPPAPPALRDPPARGGRDEEEVNPPLDVKLDLKSDHPHLIEERKLQVATVEHFGIGYCSRGIMRGTIAIPIHDEVGSLIAYAGRRLRPSDIRELGKYKFPKGFRKDHVLYNLHRATVQAKEKGMILVEGFFSVVKLFEAGFPNVAAVMGCEISEHQVKLLAGVPEVILVFDGNDAGWSGAEAARNKLLAIIPVVRTIRLPDGYEPETLSPRALRWLVNGAQALDLSEVSFRPRDAPAGG